RLQQGAVPLQEQRERRLPRGGGRHDRALGHAVVSRADRNAGEGAAGVRRHPAATPRRARQGGVPPLRDHDRQVALEGLLRRGEAGRLQQGVVGAASEVPGDRPAGAAQRGGLRSRREVPHRRERAVRALFPGAHSPVPVSPLALPDRRQQGAAEPLLDLRQQGSGGAPQYDVGDGGEPPVARGAGGVDRTAADGRDGDPRLLRAAADVAGGAEQGTELRLVSVKLPIFVLIAFPPLFLAVWFLSMHLIAAVGGWGALARVYRADGPITVAAQWRNRYGRLRYGTGYNG